MMTNVMVKTCLNQKIIKNSNLIQAMKNLCPKATVIRRPNFSENWICPSCGLNTRHDNREVTWSDSYSIFPKAEFVRIFTEYLPNVPKCGLNTRHDNREVTLIHLTRAQTLRSDKCATGSIHQTGQWLSILFHATVLPLRSNQFIFALRSDDHFCRYYNP